MRVWPSAQVAAAMCSAAMYRCGGIRDGLPRGMERPRADVLALIDLAIAAPDAISGVAMTESPTC